VFQFKYNIIIVRRMFVTYRHYSFMKSHFLTQA